MNTVTKLHLLLPTSPHPNPIVILQKTVTETAVLVEKVIKTEVAIAHDREKEASDQMIRKGDSIFFFNIRIYIQQTNDCFQLTLIFCFAAIVIRVEAVANPEIVMTKIPKARLRHPPQNIRMEVAQIVIPDQVLLKVFFIRFQFFKL